MVKLAVMVCADTFKRYKDCYNYISTKVNNEGRKREI